VHANNLEKWTPFHGQGLIHRLESDSFRILASDPFPILRQSNFLMRRRIEKRGAHEMAHRAMQYCDQIFDTQ